jgi:hypothetical protein
MRRMTTPEKAQIRNVVFIGYLTEIPIPLQDEILPALAECLLLLCFASWFSVYVLKALWSAR